jgi:SpoVK/Ycf46/Vps4 family AAA+-type ATPase
MSNFIRCLDNNTSKEIVIKKPVIKSKRHMNMMINSININYLLNNNDPIINDVYHNIYVPRKIIIKKEKVIINREINNLSDIIQLLNDFPIVSNAEYNIDLEKLHKIKDSLVKLNDMVGIHDIKNNIVDQILFYLQDFHLKNGINYMHTVLYGPPGTGKTEIAKIMGKIFSELGILKKGTFRKVVRSDLIAGYLGQTAIKTTKVIDGALGGVLFIDEAYALGNSEKRDSFAKECIDTLCEALSNHKDNLMVIIAGYEQELKECFFSYNHGLQSRFPWILKTDKSTPSELRHIFLKMVNDIKWKIKDEKDIGVEFFDKNKDTFPYFGRDMEILLLKTTIAHGRRVFCLDENEKTIINKTDIERGLELFKKYNYEKEKPSTAVYSMYN